MTPSLGEAGVVVVVVVEEEVMVGREVVCGLSVTISLV